MGVKVTLWDIPGGERSLVIGTFESVQLTGIDVIRDPDGDIVAERRAGNEWSPYAEDFHAPVEFYSDITFECVNTEEGD